MSAYAAKQLRRQRSRRTPRDRSVSVSRSLSRSDSGSGIAKRKEEIRARLQSPEQQKAAEPIPTLPATTYEAAPESMSRRDMIMAQIEALEQEKMFVQQAAQEEYKRRTSGYGSGMFGQPVVQEPEPMPFLPSAAEVVAQQQRRMSQAQMQMRESMIIPPSARFPPAPSPETSRRSSPKPAGTGLWSPSSQSRNHKQANTATTLGLWTPAGHSSGTMTIKMTSGEEDAVAQARRARGRKVMMKKQRRAEILAQIAAIEADIDPMAEIRRQDLWRARASGRGGRGPGGRNWLHERKPSRVMLRR